MRISDWSSDVCSSDLCDSTGCSHYDTDIAAAVDVAVQNGAKVINLSLGGASPGSAFVSAIARAADQGIIVVIAAGNESEANRSEEHTSELQSLMRISYAVFCLKKKTN